MKKITICMMLLVALIMGACSTKDEAEKVSEKISSGQTLDKDDYGIVISYLGQFAEKAQPIQDKIDNAEGATPELDSQLAQLKQNYPLVDEFEKALEASSERELGSANMVLLQKYGSLQWFTTPSWFVTEPDSDIAGEEVEAPQDSNGVIAGAVDEAKVKL